VHWNRFASAFPLKALFVVLLALASTVASAQGEPDEGEDAAPPPPPKGKSAQPPMISPFAGPTGSRPMPVPSGLAGLEPFDPSAEDSVEEAFLQEALVETASKRRQRLREVPMTVAWIPADELEGTGQFSLCDAIQYFPGMECRRGPMRKVAISARGLGANFLSNRLLLLQDGRPQTDPWTGQFYGDETTPLTNVKQIEVIRGPGSSLYGSNAFSGVINVIRRNPSDLMKENRDYGVDARFLGGQNNTYRLQTTGAGRLGDVEGLINYYGMQTDGPQLFNDARLGVEDHNQWARVQQVSGKLVYKGLAADADYTDSGIGRPGGTQISTVGNCGRCHFTPNDAEYVQTLNANVQYDHKVNDWLRVFGETYGVFKRRTVDLQNMVTGELQPSLGKRNRLGAEARALVSAGALHLTLGGDVKNDTINNRNILAEFAGVAISPDDIHQTIYGTFVDAEYRLFDRLLIGGGLRLDYYQIPEKIWRARSTQLSPRASVIFHAVPELLTLRTNYGRAFRAPTLAELAINQQMYAATLLGNPNLRAETLDTVEAAVDLWPAGGALRLTGTGFYNVARNFINQETKSGSTSRFENVGDAVVRGFEVELASRVKAINTSFDVAYQFLDAQNIGRDRALSRLDYAPHHRVHVRALSNFGDVAFGEIFGLFVGERQDPGFTLDPITGAQADRVTLAPYMVANARVGAHVFKGGTVSLLGSNIFNSSFQEVHGFPASPMSLFLEMRYTH
jgi:hemoglobin/transferrin/lactoferrin receptor protein